MLADGPVAYFRLGEPAGVATVKSFDGMFSGTLTPGATLGVSGALLGTLDTALALDGSTGAVSLGHEFDFTGTSPFTLEAWVKADVIDADFRMIFNKELSLAGVQTDMHNVYVYKGELSFERAVAAQTVTVSMPVPTGRFFHVACVFDSVSIAVFVDGVASRHEPDSRAAETKPVEFKIGTGNSKNFQGVIDEVAIYTKALSAERIGAHVAANHR